MPLFGRSRRPVDSTNTDAATLPGHEDTLDTRSQAKARRGIAAHNVQPHHYGKRPRVGQWIKFYWIDILTMAAMGAVGLGVYEADPAPSRSFPITFRDGEIVYPEFAYPLRNEIIPIWAAAFIAFTVPFFFFLVMQVKYRSFFDVNNATFGVLYSLITAAVFQVFIKWLIGGLRPHFLAVCKPAIPEGAGGNGYLQVMFDRKICTGDRKEINDSLESMPSGHATAAWAGLMFLTLYLNAHLKFLCDRRPRFWKMILTFAPMLGAFLISGALTIDEYHNWYDVVVGGIIGSVCAFAAYRSQYASIFDFRFNDIPLTPEFSRDAHAQRDGGGFEYAARQGAPGDAAHGASGLMNGLTGNHGGGGLMSGLNGNHGGGILGGPHASHGGLTSGHHDPGTVGTTGTKVNNGPTTVHDPTRMQGEHMV